MRITPATTLLAVAALLGLGTPAAAALPTPFPSAGGWFWGNPLPQGEDLTEVDLFGARGFTAGGGRNLLTEDAGASWRRSEHSLGSVRFVDADTVIAIGECGELLRSDDGGSQFRELRYAALTGPACGHAFAHFPTPEVGYVTDGGTLYRTKDGGATFEVRAPVSARKLLFTSADVGFGIADDAIYRTVDGAKTWSQVASSTTSLIDVDFPDAEHGYAVGFRGTLLRSRDGGITWERAPATGMPDLHLRDVRCADANTCLMAGETPKDDIFPEWEVFDSGIVRTMDGGESVQRVSSERVLALDYSSATRVVAVGRRGLMLTSDDGGVSFREVSHGSQDSYSRLSRASERVVYALGGRTGLGRSEDGGRSWNPVELVRPPRTRLSYVDFLSERTGLLIATDTAGPRELRRAHLLRTDDGSASWRVVGSHPAGRLRTAVALPRGRVVTIGRDGLGVSPDGGRSLRAVRDPRFRRLRHSALDTAPGVVVALGARGLALSRDLGRSWRRVAPPRGQSLISTEFVTPRIGFVATYYGERVFMTRNGGLSWRRVRGVGSFAAYRISFGDRRHGFINGYGAVGGVTNPYSGPFALRTSDGGRTWRPMRLGGEHLLALGSSGGVLSSEGDLFWTSAGAETRAPTRLEIRARPQTGKSRQIVVTGRLFRAEAGDRVLVSQLTRRGEQDRVPSVGGDGRFRAVFDMRPGAWVLAQWSGDAGRRPAATPALPVRLGGGR